MRRPIPRPPRYAAAVLAAVVLFWPTVFALAWAGSLVGSDHTCTDDRRAAGWSTLRQRWSWRDVGVVCTVWFGDGRVVEWVERDVGPTS